jgi:hypothetical protein
MQRPVAVATMVLRDEQKFVLRVFPRQLHRMEASAAEASTNPSQSGMSSKKPALGCVRCAARP